MKIGTGLLLLNLTIRRVDLKNIVLIVSAGFQVIILFSRNIMYNEISQFELYFSLGLIIFFLFIAVINRNYKTKTSV